MVEHGVKTRNPDVNFKAIFAVDRCRLANVSVEQCASKLVVSQLLPEAFLGHLTKFGAVVTMFAVALSVRFRFRRAVRLSWQADHAP